MIVMPQEIEVWYVFPAIRKELAKTMINLGLNQTQVSKKLGLTKAAVSQYLKDKRGKEIHFEGEIKKEIQKSASNIVTSESCVIHEINKISKLIRKTRTLCRIHKQLGGAPSKCEACLE